jgi:hypothetical protein
MKFALLITLFLFACAPVIKTEYVTVEVPVRCGIEKPARPVKDNDTALAVIDLIAYTRKLEVVLNACASLGAPLGASDPDPVSGTRDK